MFTKSRMKVYCYRNSFSPTEGALLQGMIYWPGCVTWVDPGVWRFFPQDKRVQIITHVRPGKKKPPRTGVERTHIGDRSSRLRPQRTCEQEHVGLSNAFLQYSATRTHVGPYLSDHRCVVIGQYVMGRSLMDRYVLLVGYRCGGFSLPPCSVFRVT